jgi:hypothetical protein
MNAEGYKLNISISIMKRINTAIGHQELNEAFNISQERCDQIISEMEQNTKTFVNRAVDLKMNRVIKNLQNNTIDNKLDIDNVDYQFKSVDTFRLSMSSIPENTTDEEYLMCVFLAGNSHSNISSRIQNMIAEQTREYIINFYGNETYTLFNLTVMHKALSQMFGEQDED